MREIRRVGPKDHDSRDSHLLRGVPRRLLVVAAGNINNTDLIGWFDTNLAQLIEGLAEARTGFVSTKLLVDWFLAARTRSGELAEHERPLQAQEVIPLERGKDFAAQESELSVATSVLRGDISASATKSRRKVTKSPQTCGTGYATALQDVKFSPQILVGCEYRGCRPDRSKECLKADLDYAAHLV